jgi:alkyl sulfatase BDS1-like metallo-beta-lactamase superfamily hydrolase
MEQLGYQAESSTWRNAYLMGAFELRHGTVQLGRGGPPLLAGGMTGEQLIDMMAARFDPAKCASATLSVAFTVTDLNPEESPTHRLTVQNSTVHHDAGTTEADVAVTLDRAAMVEVIAYPERLDERIADGTIAVDAGDTALLAQLLGALDTFVSPNIVEP